MRLIAKEELIAISGGNDGGISMSEGTRLAEEALACKIAADRLSRSPTLTNCATAAGVCTEFVKDVVQTVPWGEMMSNSGAAQMAEAEARGMGMGKGGLKNTAKELENHQQ